MYAMVQLRRDSSTAARTPAPASARSVVVDMPVCAGMIIVGCGARPAPKALASAERMLVPLSVEAGAPGGLPAGWAGSGSTAYPGARYVDPSALNVVNPPS